MSFHVTLFPEGVFDQMAQFVGRAGDRLMQGLRIARHVEGLMPFQPRLHGTTHCVGSALGTVFIAYMDFDAGDMGALMTESVLHDVLNMRGQGLAALNIAVGIDLDLHYREKVTHLRPSVNGSKTRLVKQKLAQYPYNHIHTQMKTTLDIDDDLLIEAKTLAVRRRTTLKALVEHALKREIQPHPGVTTNLGADELIEVGPHGLPRLVRPGAIGSLTTERVRQMMDEEGL